MAQPTRNQTRPVDPVLSDFSIGSVQENWIADEAAPVLPVEEQSATYFEYTRDYWFRVHDGAERAEGGRALRIGYGVEHRTYRTRDRTIEKPLDDVVDAASQLPEGLSVTDIDFLTRQIQMHIETDTAGIVFASGNWGTDDTLSGTDQWSDYADSDPIADAKTASRTIRRNTGSKPDRLILGDEAWEDLRDHPLIVDRFKHTQAGVLTEELVAPLMDVNRIVVGSGIQNNAAQGAAFNGADIWADNALFVVQAPTPGFRTPTGAYRFHWNFRNAVPWGIDTYRSEEIQSMISRVISHYDVQVVAPDYGYLFLDVSA